MSDAPRSLGHRLFRQRYGNLTWDGVIRGTGLVALVAIPLTVLLPLAVGGLIAFVLVTIWVNGPWGLFLPTTYEPILMLFGRLYPPLLIGWLGILGTLYIEFLNYLLAAKILHLDALKPARESRTVRTIVRLFNKAPFFTIWLCSWSPLPYWAVRILAPIARYPLDRYLFATFLGRFPRLWFFAALGTWWQVSMRLLFAITVASIIVAVTVAIVSSRRRRAPVPAVRPVPVSRRGTAS